MKKYLIGLMVGAAMVPAAAFAQDTTAPGTTMPDPATTMPDTTTTAPDPTMTPSDPAMTTPDSTMTTPDSTMATPDTTAQDTTMGSMAEPTSPDGSPAFGFEPYVGIQGGYHEFDSDNRGPLTTNCNGGSGCPDGGIVEAFAGANVPLGPGFVGVEGNIAKGFKGLDWEYGVYGRVGARAGDSGLIYVKGGYQWIDTKEKGKDDDWSYGVGVEVGPKDIGLGGLTGNAGVRLRLEATTYDFQSVRPMAGVVLHL